MIESSTYGPETAIQSPLVTNSNCNGTASEDERRETKTTNCLQQAGVVA